MRNRSVIEIMVLCFTLVVTLAIMGLSTAIVIIEVNTPEADTTVISTTLMSLVSGILGALLGLLAGRSTQTDSLTERPREDVDA